MKLSVLATAAAFLLVACGGDSTSGGGSSSGSSADLAQVGDSATDPMDMAQSKGGGFMCGSMSCAPGTSCCVVGMTPSCSTSCPDGGFVASCAGPQDCQTGSSCCIAFGDNFSVQSVMCAPMASCVPTVSASGSGMDRACQTDSDCTDDGKGGNNGTYWKNCCTNTTTNQHVCFNATVMVNGWKCP